MEEKKKTCGRIVMGTLMYGLVYRKLLNKRRKKHGHFKEKRNKKRKKNTFILPRCWKKGIPL